MREHPHAELIRRGYEAFAEGDMAALSDMMAEDVVWHVPGEGPLAGEHRGREAVLGFFKEARDLSGGTLQVNVQSIVALEKVAVALTRLRASRAGKDLDAIGAVVYKVKDGKINEAWSLARDVKRKAEFFSSMAMDGPASAISARLSA
jgi:ketosteroid isomerase-like protein